MEEVWEEGWLEEAWEEDWLEEEWEEGWLEEAWAEGWLEESLVEAEGSFDEEVLFVVLLVEAAAGRTALLFLRLAIAIVGLLGQSACLFDKHERELLHVLTSENWWLWLWLWARVVVVVGT